MRATSTAVGEIYRYIVEAPNGDLLVGTLVGQLSLETSFDTLQIDAAEIRGSLWSLRLDGHLLPKGRRGSRHAL